MKRPYLFLMLIVLIQCQTKVDSLNGHYIGITDFGGRWETMEIEDSLVLVNRIIMYTNTRDTIIIDPSTKKIARIVSESGYPIFDINVTGDTIEVCHETDMQPYCIKFVKATQTNPKYHIANSYIDINLADYNNEELVSTIGLKIKNLTVGFLQETYLKRPWTGARDTVYIEFDNSIFLQKSELQMLKKWLIQSADTKWILCLNFDRRVPESMSKEIKECLRRDFDTLKIIESRNRGKEIVYVK